MSLDQIAIRNKTDKSSQHHGYTKYYELFFEPLRLSPVKLLELGTGAYWKENEGFHGAKTWAEYFSNGHVTTIDIVNKRNPHFPKIDFYQGSQDDVVFLKGVIDKMGAPDIIIDDASHISPLTVRSFEILFDFLAPGGYYVVEDTHASYWGLASDGTDFKGGINNPASILNFLKALTDTINHKECEFDDRGIESIHFYEKIVFIKKR